MEKENDSFQLMRLSEVHSNLASRLPPSEAESRAALCANKLLAAILKEDDPNSLDNLSFELCSLTRRLKPGEDTASRLTQATDRLLSVMEKETDSHRLHSLASPLSSLVEGLERTEGEKRAILGTDYLLEAIEKESDFFTLDRLFSSLSALGMRIEPADAASRAARGINRLLTAMESKEKARRVLLRPKPFTTSLPALVAQLPTVDLPQVTERILAIMGTETDADRLDCLRQALSALASRLQTAVSERTIAPLLALMERESNRGRCFEISLTLAALAGGVNSVDATRACDRLTTAMEEETDVFRLASLGYCLAAFTRRLEPANARLRAARGSYRLLKAIERAGDVEQLYNLKSVLFGLVIQFEPAEARQAWLFAWSNQPLANGTEIAMKDFSELLQLLNKRELTGVLKWPFCVGEAEKLVLAELERKLSAEFQREIQFGGDVGKFVAQAKSLGIHHLAEPAQRPTLAAARAELAEILQAASPPPSQP